MRRAGGWLFVGPSCLTDFCCSAGCWLAGGLGGRLEGWLAGVLGAGGRAGQPWVRGHTRLPAARLCPVLCPRGFCCLAGAVSIGVSASFFFYFTVAVVGYCALGNGEAQCYCCGGCRHQAWAAPVVPGIPPAPAAAPTHRVAALTLTDAVSACPAPFPDCRCPELGAVWLSRCSPLVDNIHQCLHSAPQANGLAGLRTGGWYTTQRRHRPARCRQPGRC